MTDHRNIPPRDVSPEGAAHNRRIPPLVWVILALVLIALAVGAFGGFNMHHADQVTAAAVRT